MKNTRKPFSNAPRHSKGRQKGNILLQALQVSGDFKFQDPHPVYENLFYHKIGRRGKQVWMTGESLDHYLAQNRKWTKDNAAQVYTMNKKWAAVNTKKIRTYQRKWCQSNPHMLTAATARYRSRIKNNIPLSESISQAIDAIYKLREELTLAARAAGSSDSFHVDHILPLNHALFSGLHAPWNLQILEASENIRKSNKVTF